MINFIIGLITGSIVGITFMALLSINKDSENSIKRIDEKNGKQRDNY